MTGVQSVVLMLKLGSVQPIPSNPWFPATACCLGLCLLSQQSVILESFLCHKDISSASAEKDVLTCNPHVSKTNNLCRLQRTIQNPFPSRCLALSRAAAHQTSTAFPGAAHQSHQSSRAHIWHAGGLHQCSKNRHALVAPWKIINKQ